MRLGAHGDILMATPLLTALRTAYPDAWITWIVEHREQESIDAHPCIDEYLLWSGSAWKNLLRHGLLPIWAVHAIRLRKTLADRRYDLFISLQPEEWPLLTRAVAAPVSIGVFDTFRQFHGDKPTNRNTRLFRPAYVQSDLPEHRTDQYLLPLRALGLPVPADKQMTMGYTEKDDDVVMRFLSEQGVEAHDQFVVIAPMTTWPSRCWDGARYASLGNALARDQGVKIVLMGSPSERAQVEAVSRDFDRQPIMAAGVFTFRQAAALTARAALVVSGDTGPMHLAAAVGTPYLALFGPTPVLARAPLAGRGVALAHAVPCGPCDQKICSNGENDFMRCMRLLTVEEVASAASNILNGMAVRS